MGWAAQEFAGVDLGDKRLNRRLARVAQQWADKPTQSIPGASAGWGDTAAAYGCWATSAATYVFTPLPASAGVAWVHQA